MKIELTKQEAYDAYESGKVVGTMPWRWGTRKLVVFERDGKHFQAEFECHSEEGLQVYDGVEAIEVVPREKTITEWVPA